MITVTEESDHRFAVRAEGETFEVLARPEYIRKVFGENPPASTDIVRASFEFLLKRESIDDILKEFDLSVIETYFPEYPTVIKEAVS